MLDSGVLSGTAYPSDSCTVILFVIVADLESQLEIVSEVPGESIRFSSRRTVATQSVVGSHCWNERCRENEERCTPRKKSRRLRCWGSPAASRKSSSSALQEARTLLGARAGTSSTRPPVTPARAVTLKSDVPLRQPLDFAEVLAKLATVLGEPRSPRSLEKEFGVDMGWATTETKYTEVYDGGSEGEGLRRLGGHA